MKFSDYMLANVSCQMCNTRSREVRAVKGVTGYWYQCERCYNLAQVESEKIKKEFEATRKFHI